MLPVLPSAESWQTLLPLGLSEVKGLMTAYHLEVVPTSPLMRAAGQPGASSADLRRRGLLEVPGVRPAPGCLAVKGALEVLARRSRELLVVKAGTDQEGPEVLAFALSSDRACLCLSTPEGFAVGAPIPLSQLFSVLSRDLKGGGDDRFAPFALLSVHQQLLLALKAAGLLGHKRGFTRAALVQLVAQLKLDPEEAGRVVGSALRAGVLVPAGSGYALSSAAWTLMERLGSGELTELVLRDPSAPEGALPRSMLFAGPFGRRLWIDSPPPKASAPGMVSFAPVTGERLGATLGGWLGLAG